MIRVIVAEDFHLVRRAICALLEKAVDVQIVAEAEDGRQAVELVERLAPDVLLIDLSMPRLNGIQAIGQIRALDVPTQGVILSIHSEDALVRQALRSGAKGYLLKRSLAEELPLALHSVARGDIYLSPAVSTAILTDFLAVEPAARPGSAFEQLSPREREVLKLIAEGYTNNAIADMLQVSVKTVEKHRTNLMEKLDIHEVAGLVRTAIKHGLVFLDE